MRTFADSLKELRDLRRWTQEEAAQHLGVTRQTVGAWEREKENPSAARVKQVQDLLEIEHRKDSRTVGEFEHLREELRDLAGLMNLDNLRELHRQAEELVRDRLNQRRVDRAEISDEEESVARLRKAADALRRPKSSRRPRASGAG